MANKAGTGSGESVGICRQRIEIGSKNDTAEWSGETKLLVGEALESMAKAAASEVVLDLGALRLCGSEIVRISLGYGKASAWVELEPRSRPIETALGPLDTPARFGELLRVAGKPLGMFSRLLMGAMHRMAPAASKAALDRLKPPLAEALAAKGFQNVSSGMDRRVRESSAELGRLLASAEGFVPSPRPAGP